MIYLFRWIGFGAAARDATLVSNQRLGHISKSIALGTDGWKGSTPFINTYGQRGFRKGDEICFGINPSSRIFAVYLNARQIIQTGLTLIEMVVLNYGILL